MGASPERLILLAFLTLILSSEAQRRFLYLKPGDGFSINCSDSVLGIRSVYLYKEDTRLFSYGGSSDPMREARGGSRVIISGTLRSPRFTLTEVKDFDSGIYYCRYESAGGPSNGRATLVFVSGEISCIPAQSSVSAAGDQEIFLILTIVFLVLSVFIYIVILIIWLIPKVKKSRERKVPGRCSDSVYEVMQMHVSGADASKREQAEL